MRFLHMADMHFDSSFVLGSNSKIGEKMRLNKRKVFSKVVEYVRERNIPYFFISGDLYEQENIRKSTIEFINKEFEKIPNTHIFIVPGNHDPYLKNSYYQKFNWNKNVHIFTKELKRLEFDGVDIYGYGFEDYYMENPYKKIEIKNKNKLNILLTHGNLDMISDKNKPYNDLKTEELNKLGFDYIALGHIHKPYYKEYENQNIVYPGSTVSNGFDELGEHGVIVGTLLKEGSSSNLKLEFLSLDNMEFIKTYVDITKMNSNEEIIESLNDMKLDNSKFYEISLVGKRNFEIDRRKVLDLIEKEEILKIKDDTELGINIEKLANSNTLKGIFAKNILRKMKNNEITEEEKNSLERVLEIGLEVLK